MEVRPKIVARDALRKRGQILSQYDAAIGSLKNLFGVFVVSQIGNCDGWLSSRTARSVGDLREVVP